MFEKKPRVYTREFKKGRAKRVTKKKYSLLEKRKGEMGLHHQKGSLREKKSDISSIETNSGGKIKY